jgi:CRP-like cAMP-binding protein
MTVAKDVQAKMAAHPLFEGVARSQLNWLLNVGQVVALQKQAYLFHRGQPSGCLYVLLSGHIKLSIPAERGSEKVLEFLAPGDVFGESALLPGDDVIVDAQALEPCELLAIAGADVMAVVTRAPFLAQKMLTNLSKRVQTLFRDMESVSLLSAAQRVAEYLLRQPREGNQARLPYHKRAIASKLGLQPETFSRSLQQLAADGLISVRGAKVEIHDPDKLQNLLI